MLSLTEQKYTGQKTEGQSAIIAFVSVTSPSIATTGCIHVTILAMKLPVRECQCLKQQQRHLWRNWKLRLSKRNRFDVTFATRVTFQMSVRKLSMLTNNKRFCFVQSDVSTVCEWGISQKISRLKRNASVARATTIRHFAPKTNRSQVKIRLSQHPVSRKKKLKFCFKWQQCLCMEKIEATRSGSTYCWMVAVRDCVFQKN